MNDHYRCPLPACSLGIFQTKRFKVTLCFLHRPWAMISMFINARIGRYACYLVIFSQYMRFTACKVVYTICYINNCSWIFCVWYRHFGAPGCFCHLFVSGHSDSGIRTIPCLRVSQYIRASVAVIGHLKTSVVVNFRIMLDLIARNCPFQ